MPEDVYLNMRWAKKMLMNVNNFTLPEGHTPKISSKIGVLFPIVERIFNDKFKLELLFDIKVHLIYHVSLRKPTKETTT